MVLVLYKCGSSLNVYQELREPKKKKTVGRKLVHKPSFMESNVVGPWVWNLSSGIHLQNYMQPGRQPRAEN